MRQTQQPVRWAGTLMTAWAAMLLFAALFAGLFTNSAHAQQPERRVALIIGNSQYVSVPKLDNPGPDARLMADTFAALGFTLVGGKAHLDLDKQSLENVVQSFGKAIQGANVALFYYAGHGLQIRGGNFLVPVNANPTREADADFQLLNVDLVLRQMELAGTRLNMVILDACRNNPFASRGLRSTGGGLAQMQAPEGTLLAYATQPGNVAQDGADGHSPYTRALAKAVATPGLDVFSVFNDVGVAVKRATNSVQQPWVSSSPLEGKFYFAGSSPDGPAPAVPQPALVALAPSSTSRTSSSSGSRLRSTPQTLSADDAKVMVVTQNFYRAGWNTQGRGGPHQYETQVHAGGLVVVNPVTGLMWQRSGSGMIVQGGQQGAEQYVQSLNAKRFGGFDDWRLPTLDEAMSLMMPPDGGQPLQTSAGAAKVHLASAFETGGAYFIWTSDLQASGRGWVVYYVDAACNGENLQYNAYVRAVRSLTPK